MQCIKCGAELPEGARFCANCGAKVEESAPNPADSCPQCGAPIEPGSKFCANCGASLPQKEESAKAAAEAPEKKKAAGSGPEEEQGVSGAPETGAASAADGTSDEAAAPAAAEASDDMQAAGPASPASAETSGEPEEAAEAKEENPSAAKSAAGEKTETGETAQKADSAGAAAADKDGADAPAADKDGADAAATDKDGADAAATDNDGADAAAADDDGTEEQNSGGWSAGQAIEEEDETQEADSAEAGPKKKHSFRPRKEQVMALEPPPSPLPIIIGGIIAVIGVVLFVIGFMGSRNASDPAAMSELVAANGPQAYTNAAMMQTIQYAAPGVIAAGAVLAFLSLRIRKKKIENPVIAEPAPAAEDSENPAPQDPEAAAAAAEKKEKMLMLICVAACAVLAAALPVIMHTAAASACDGYWVADDPGLERKLEGLAVSDTQASAVQNFERADILIELIREDAGGYSYGWYWLFEEGEEETPAATIHLGETQDTLLFMEGDCTPDPIVLSRVDDAQWEELPAEAVASAVAEASGSADQNPEDASSADSSEEPVMTFAPPADELPADAAETYSPEPAPEGALLPSSDPVSADLNGDGTAESVSLDTSGATAALVIDGNTVALPFATDPERTWSLYAANIDAADPSAEIIIESTGEYWSEARIYRYADGALYPLRVSYAVPPRLTAAGAQPMDSVTIISSPEGWVLAPGDGTLLFPGGVGKDLLFRLDGNSLTQVRN